MLPERTSVVLALLLAGAPFDSASADGADRTTEVFRYACGNELGRRDLTLFGNGTVRFRQWTEGAMAMRLGELDPERLAIVIARLDPTPTRWRRGVL